MRLHDTTPEIWFKIQRMKAHSQERIEEIQSIYDTWKNVELHVKLPYVINLSDGQTINQKVYFIGYKTDGVNLFTAYKITYKGPTLTQEIRQ